MSGTSGDVSLIHDEDLLRKMWQETEDFGRKKEIRAHMYKMREARLRDFYNSGEVSTEIQQTTTKSQSKMSGASHTDALADHSFLSLKSKEIRDSESPTRDVSYRIIDKNLKNQQWGTTGCENQFSTSISNDGKTVTTSKVSSTSGTETFEDGKMDFAAKNQQQKSVYQDGDDKNYTKAVRTSSSSVMTQNTTGGDANNKNNSFKSSSTRTSSSSHFVKESNISDEVDNKVILAKIPKNDDYLVSRKIYTDNIPEDLKAHPSFVEGRTKVTRETRTLPDGTTLTTTRYEIAGESSKQSSRKNQVSSNKSYESNVNRTETRSTNASTATKYVDSSQEKPSVTKTQQIETSIQVIPGKPQIIESNQKETTSKSTGEYSTTAKKYFDSTQERSQVPDTYQTQIQQSKTVNTHRTEAPTVTTTITKHVSDYRDQDQLTATNKVSETIEENKIVRETVEGSKTTPETKKDREPLKSVETKKDREPLKSPERTKTIKPHKSELDTKTQATDGQYDTTYRADYTSKKISVELSPTHEAFARSLRAITPDRVKSPSPSSHHLRDSNAILRSSTSPEKIRCYVPTQSREIVSTMPAKHPSNEKTPKGNSPERRSASPRKHISTETITKASTTKQKKITNIDSSTLTRRKQEKIKSVERTPSPTITASEIEFFGNTDIVTDLDTNETTIVTKTRPESLHIVKKITKKITDRSPTSPFTESAKKESPRRSSLKTDETPRPFKRTDTYEERCRQILGITNDTSTRRSSLENIKRRGSATKKLSSPEKQPEISKSELLEQLHETYKVNKETVDTRDKETSQVDRFLTEIRANEEHTREDRRQKVDGFEEVQLPRRQSHDVTSSTDDVSKCQTTSDLSVQVRKSLENHASKDVFEKTKPVEETLKISEFPSQVRRSPEKVSAEPISDQTRPVEELSKISEVPFQIRRSPEKMSQPVPEKASLIKDVLIICEPPSQVQPSPEKVSREPIFEKPSSVESVPKILEFPSQLQRLPEKVPHEPTPEKASPAKTVSKIAEFPSQVRKSPERISIESLPSKVRPVQAAPQILEFPAQNRRSPEKQISKPIPEEVCPRQESSKIAEFPSQIRRSPEKELSKPIPEKVRPSKESPKIAEFPSQVRRSPEKELSKPIPEKVRPSKESPKIAEFPSQIRRSPEKELSKPIPEKVRPSKESPRIAEFPSQIRRSPEKELSKPIPEKVRPSKESPRIAEFSSQIRRSPEKELSKPIPEKVRPSKESPKIAEFPSQMRRSPEKLPVEKFPEKIRAVKEVPKVSEFSAQVRREPEKSKTAPKKLDQKRSPERSIKIRPEVAKSGPTDKKVTKQRSVPSIKKTDGINQKQTISEKRFSAKELVTRVSASKIDSVEKKHPIKKVGTGYIDSTRTNKVTKKEINSSDDEGVTEEVSKTYLVDLQGRIPIAEPLATKKFIDQLCHEDTNQRRDLTKKKSQLDLELQVTKTGKNTNKTVKKDTVKTTHNIFLKNEQNDTQIRKLAPKTPVKKPVKKTIEHSFKTTTKTTVTTKPDVKIDKQKTPKRHVVTTTIDVSPKPTRKVPVSKTALPNGDVSSEDEVDSLEETTVTTQKRDKCITTKSIIINNEVGNREIIVDLQRSKSSREPTPDRICPLPVSSDDDTSPRFPDQIAEPDEIIRKPTKITDIPLFEDTDVEEFSRIVEVESIPRDDIDETSDLDVSLLSVNKKISKFSDTRPKTPQASGVVPKVDRPSFQVTEDLKSDECLLSVSEKVSKFITTAEQLTAPQDYPRPKSPRHDIRVRDFNQDSRKNISIASLETLTTRESPDRRGSPTKRIDSPNKRPDSPVKRVESPVRRAASPVKGSEYPVQRSESPVKRVESAIKRAESPVKRVESPVKRRDVPEQRRITSPDRFDSPPRTKTPSKERTHKTGKWPGKEESPKLPDSTPKSSRTDKPKPLLSSTSRLRSSESVQKAKAMFEKINTEQEKARQRDILSRPSVFEGRKATETETARKLTYETDDSSALKSTKLLLEKIRARSKSPEKPTERRSSSPEFDGPGYMKPLDRSLRPRSPHRGNVEQYQKTAETREEQEVMTSDSIVLLKNSDSTRRQIPEHVTEEKIETIYDLYILEILLEKVVSYELRRKIRAQIRLVKTLSSEGRLSEVVTKAVTKEISKSPERTSEVTTKRIVQKAKSPERNTSHTTSEQFSSSYSYNEQSIKKVEETKESKLRRSSKSPEKTQKSGSKLKDQAKKPEEKVIPNWVKQRNLRKVETPRTVTQSSHPKETKSIDLITSSYGVGPTDENGSPLFGLRALRSRKNAETKVQGTVVKSQYYSENGKEPVGEISVTKYSTDPRDLGRDEEPDDTGIASITTTQKFGYKDTPSLKNLTTTTKTKQICDDSEISRSSKFERRGSVKAISQKFTESGGEISKMEKQTSYPKAGLILRTSSFKDTTKRDTSRESSEEKIVTIKSSSSSSRTVTGDTFLTNRDKVTGVQDVISRMKAEDIREGDSLDDTEARSLLNKFLGAQVILTGLESNVQNTTANTQKSTKITTTTTKGGKPVTQTRIFKHPITDEELNSIWEEETLRLLLEQSTDYEERKNIRARLRKVMAEQEGMWMNIQQKETTEIKQSFSEGPTRTSQVTTRTSSTTSHQVVKKPISPFAKFRELDKQNSVGSSPSTPKTPSGSGPLFKFTDPAVSQSASTIKDRLLYWCRMKTKEYENIQLDNFSTSWADGLAFCALVHHFLPDSFDYHALTPQNRRHNFTLAFKVADEKADIAPLLDVDDMVASRKPDWKCVFTYVQSIYRRFKDED